MPVSRRSLPSATAPAPHARPTDRKIGESAFVLVDWGADGGLYKSDLRVGLVTAKIPPKLERIYRVVLRAQEQAIAAIRPGISCLQVDAVARGIIHEAGFGKNSATVWGTASGWKSTKCRGLRPARRSCSKSAWW